MYFEPNYFAYASNELTSAHYAQCQAELLACFGRDWRAASRDPVLAVPAGVVGPSALGVPRGLPRSWATTPPDMSQLGLRTRRLLRFENAADHALTATLAERHIAFTRTVEFLLFDVARRLQPWGAVLPAKVEWLASNAGPPTVIDLGIALSPTSYSLVEAFDEAELVLTFEEAEGMPSLWSRTLADAIRWEKAAALQLKIPKPFGAPGPIVGRGFHEFENPFLQICNLWRSGVVVVSSFDASPSLLSVNAQRL